MTLQSGASGCKPLQMVAGARFRYSYYGWHKAREGVSHAPGAPHIGRYASIRQDSGRVSGTSTNSQSR